MIRLLLSTMIVLAFSFPRIVRGEGIELQLQSSVQQKLPALPIPLRVVAFNRGDSALYLPPVVFFYAAREGAGKFLGGDATGWSKTPIGDEDLDPNWDPRIVLEPGKTITAEFPVRHDCVDPSFFLNTFLWVPGRYQFRVLAAENTGHLLDAMQGDSLSEVVQTVPDLILSEPVTIDILEPSGVDAEAWNYLRERTQRNHWPYFVGLGDDRPVLQTLRERFPTSQYTFCVNAGAASTRNLPLAELNQLAAQIRAAPKPQFMLEWVELAIAGHHTSKCSQYVLYSVPRNVAAAADECEMAYAIYQRLSSSGENSLVRTKAAEGLADSPKRKELYDYAAEIEAMLGRQLRPFVTCVTDTISALTVTFGYENPGDSERALPIGPGNRFAPAPESRGQPVTFLPGRHPNAMTIRVAAKRDDPARAISWSLNGMTATPSKNDPKCR